MLERRCAHLPADPLALGQRIATEPGAFLLCDGTGRSASFLGFGPLEERGALDPEPDLVRTAGQPRVPRWVGVLPYEAMRHLERPGGRRDARPAPLLPEARWARYGAVARVLGDEVWLVGDDAQCLDRLEEALSTPGAARVSQVEPRGPQEAPERHRERIEQALEQIEAGELYQVNLARCFTFKVSGYPIDILNQSPQGRSFPFAAALSIGGVQVVSSSPELFLELEAGGRLLTSPIKGTRPRGSDAAEDAALRAELDADEKERAELVMVLDVERNDLGRVAKTGSVRLISSPSVSTFATLHHRLAVLEAQIRPEVTRSELLEAMLPSGSVTGAPKRRAMELIRDLEPVRRGLYTGALGALCHDGSLSLGMAIRTLTYRDGQGSYFSGGGIVADSDPAREIEETAWKTRQFWGP